jgi:phosphoglycolate phosphatase (TIGR01487 family)
VAYPDRQGNLELLRECLKLTDGAAGDDSLSEHASLPSEKKREDAKAFKDLVRDTDVKVVFCDIDGTITDERLRFSIPGIRAIRRLKEAGIPTVLASGSCWYAVDIFARYLDAHSTVVAENGAVIMSRSRFSSSEGDGLFFLGKPEKETVLGSQVHPKRFLSYLKKKLPLEKIVLAADMPFRLVEVVLERIFPFDFLKKQASQEDFSSHIRVVDTKFAYHISPRGTNKGRALQITCKDHLSIPLENTLAIGDGPNDIEMITKAQIGVAVANGDAKLKLKADYVTNASFGSGLEEIAEMILKF